MRNTGIYRRIDSLGRIVIPKEIRNSLRIVDNESLELFLDGESIILKKHSELKNFSRISQILLESTKEVKKYGAIIYDSSKIIASIGEYKKELLDTKPSNELLNYLKSYNVIDRSGKISLSDSLTISCNYYASPIIKDSIIIGIILTFSDNLITCKDVVNMMARFLGKYMEI